jgi:membrane associated rhomboid family serine protease
MMQVAAQKPPWEAEDVFPTPLDGHPYGYMAGGTLKPSSREELTRKCGRTEIPAVQLVWTPETPRLVPPYEVPFLRDFLQSRARHLLWVRIFSSSVFGLLWAGSLVVAWPQGPWPLFLVLLLLTGVWPLVQSLKVLRSLKLEPIEEDPQVREYARYAAWLATRPSMGTWLLMGCIGAVGIWQLVIGLDRSIAAGGLIKQMVREGEAWRLVSGALVHANILHFGFNVAALEGLGKTVEGLTNRALLAAVFLISLFAGSLCSLLLLPETTSVGASGGILGLFGFLAVLGYRHRNILPNGFTKATVVPVLLIGIAGLIAPDLIDNAAHLGGFLAGAALGAVALPRRAAIPLHAGPLVRTFGWIALGAILAAGVLAILLAPSTAFSP